jgi:hypothetical protein
MAQTDVRLHNLLVESLGYKIQQITGTDNVGEVLRQHLSEKPLDDYIIVPAREVPESELMDPHVPRSPVTPANIGGYSVIYRREKPAPAS